MNQTERLYRIRQLFATHRSLSTARLQSLLEVSRATLKRDIELLRYRLHIPIVWDRELAAYHIDKQDPDAGTELPGLWFSSTEIHALLTMQHLLENLDPGGLLTPHIRPLAMRIESLLDTPEHTADEIRTRVFIVGMGKRTLKLAHFERVGAALLSRKRLHITYAGRGRGTCTEREISPQRLTHYRDNWYLDAWCHLREELRNFSLDAIESVQVLEKSAREISRPTLNKALGPGYGIFTGQKIKWATLRFTPERARWVAAEHWHADQRGTFDPDGCYRLEIPYADDRELIMDILKHGAEVEVLAPPELRERLKEEIARMAGHYG